MQVTRVAPGWPVPSLMHRETGHDGSYHLRQSHLLAHAHPGQQHLVAQARRQLRLRAPPHSGRQLLMQPGSQSGGRITAGWTDPATFSANPIRRYFITFACNDAAAVNPGGLMRYPPVDDEVSTVRAALSPANRAMKACPPFLPLFNPRAGWRSEPDSTRWSTELKLRPSALEWQPELHAAAATAYALSKSGCAAAFPWAGTRR
jgi:hypothetical protein